MKSEIAEPWDGLKSTLPTCHRYHLAKNTYECADEANRQGSTCFNRAECAKTYGFLHGQDAKKAGVRLKDNVLQRIKIAYAARYSDMPGHLRKNNCRAAVAPP